MGLPFRRHTRASRTRAAMRNRPRMGIVQLFTDAVVNAWMLLRLEPALLHLFPNVPKLFERASSTCRSVGGFGASERG